ncbi:MAG: MFS transporter, partial [Gammaproteobacteria bacterium]
IFLVNLPFGLAGLWMTRRYMPDYRSAERVPLDLIGFALFGIGVAGISWALEQVIDANYAQAGVAAATSALLLATYTWRSLALAHPIVDLRLLRITSFRIGINGGFSTRLGVRSIYFLLTLLFQVGFGYSAIAAGLLQMPQALAMGYRRVLLANTALAGLAILSFATFTPTTPLWLICVQVFASGAVMSLQYAALNTLGFVDLAPTEASMGSAMTSTAQNLSMSFGVAFGSLLMAFFLPADVVQGAHYIAAFHATVIVLGLVTLLSSLVFLRLPHSAAA